MAKINIYPIGTPKSSDLLVGTSIPDPNTNKLPKTKNFKVSNITSLIAAEIPEGPAGPAGQDGAPGANGSNGENGAPGTNGVQGVPGADGTSISILGTVANCAALPPTGNTVGDLYILDADDPVCGGTAGDGYVWTAGNTWLNIGPLRGPQGEQGVTGTDGLPGPAGTPGTDGAPGETGSPGPRGIQGIPGATGGVSSVTAGTNIVVDPATGLGDVTVSAPNAIVNTADNFGGPIVVNIVCLESDQYPPLTGVDGNTLYVII